MSSARPNASRNCGEPVVIFRNDTGNPHRRLALIAGGFALIAGEVCAEAAKPAPVVPASPLNLILGLLFLALMVAAAWWLLRRVNGAQWPLPRAAMKVVASLPLGQRERVVVVEIAGQQWLLGVTPAQVTLLHRFDEPVIAAGSGPDDFAGRMRQILNNSVGRSQ
jgi:flagellar protein FliO/FliZ